MSWFSLSICSVLGGTGKTCDLKKNYYGKFIYLKKSLHYYLFTKTKQSCEILSAKWLKMTKCFWLWDPRSFSEWVGIQYIQNLGGFNAKKVEPSDNFDFTHSTSESWTVRLISNLNIFWIFEFERWLKKFKIKCFEYFES